MGWTRSSVYIANTTKCRPPGNRNPEPDELDQCMPFLHAQIASIAPRVIVALGRPASNQLLGVDAPISSLRGKFHDYPRLTAERHSLKITPTVSPSAYSAARSVEEAASRVGRPSRSLALTELARLGITPPARHPSMEACELLARRSSGSIERGRARQRAAAAHADVRCRLRRRGTALPSCAGCAAPAGHARH